MDKFPFSPGLFSALGISAEKMFVYSEITCTSLTNYLALTNGKI